MVEEMEIGMSNLKNSMGVANSSRCRIIIAKSNAILQNVNLLIPFGTIYK